MDRTSADSPPIHRCGLCGGLVHPGDRSSLAAWCRRCRRIVNVTPDGGVG